MILGGAKEAMVGSANPPAMGDAIGISGGKTGESGLCATLEGLVLFGGTSPLSLAPQQLSLVLLVSPTPITLFEA